MALIHRAQVVPTKLEALAAWVPGRLWAAGVDASALTQVGAYRFDDPDGAVGVETILLRAADGRLLQVPLTYRAAPLDGAGDALVTEMHHSVLGSRWVYDGCADPVAVRAVPEDERAGVLADATARLEAARGPDGRITLVQGVRPTLATR